MFRLYDNGGAGVKMSATSGGDISFYEDTGTTPKFFWDASAESLGIGTSSPSSKLHISQATDALASGLQIRNAADTSSLFIYQDGIDTKYDTGTSGSQIFRTNSTERMRIDSSGNVGIGTSSPSQKLDISAGYLNFSNAYGIRWGGNTTEAIYGNNTGNLIGFQTNGSEAMRIDSSGNVGIGLSSNIGATLHVDAEDNVPLNAFGSPLIKVGGANSWAGNGSLYSIGFGHTNTSAKYAPAEIGLETTNSGTDTKGDLVFATKRCGYEHSTHRTHAHRQQRCVVGWYN